MKKFLLLFWLVVLGTFGYSQSDQLAYLEAKRLFNANQYLSAKAAFGALESDEYFGSYAGFYRGVCAYHLGDKKESLLIFKNLESQNNDWKQNAEVVYWISLLSFENSNFSEGVKYAQTISKLSGNVADEVALVEYFCSSLDAGQLRDLQVEFPDNETLAGLCLGALMKVNVADRDLVAIENLVAKWGFDLNDFDPLGLPKLKKETYNIGVLLPFLFEGFDNTERIVLNKFVMDMYQGMLMAANDLSDENVHVNILPYDTKKSRSETMRVLNSEGFEGNDVIIGALYDAPSEEVRKFALENKINYINPVTSYEKMISDNQFSFLNKPSYETMARTLGSWASRQADIKTAMIFFEQTERDSSFARSFRRQLEKDSIDIAVYQSITKDNMKLILDTLAAQYEHYLFKSEADSIRKLAGRFVRERRVRREEFRKMEKDTTFTMPVNYNDDGEPIVYYEKLFHMKPDSIGIILAATRSNLFANNLISVVETRGDSIDLYGYGDWLDFTMLSYSQLDRLNVGLCHPDYLNTDSENYKRLSAKTIETYKTTPTFSFIRGYELVYFVGKKLSEEGRYFQRGIRNGQYTKGKIMEGFRYGALNDNQVVPIVKFENAKLKVVNRGDYEN